MSICSSGLDTPCRVQPVTITVSPSHPLIQLAQVLPWQALAELVFPDLKKTTLKGKWWLGRKLKLRIHLGAFLLQWLYNLTDRQVEWALKDNAAYQLFCGRGASARGTRLTTPRLRNSGRAYPQKRSATSPMRSPSGQRSWGLLTPPRWILILQCRKPILPIRPMRI
jgi:hypothetical protein